MKPQNSMKIEFEARSVNESFARSVIAAFVAPLDPTLEELADIKTAVSEAVTNSIVHGYCKSHGYVYMDCEADGNTVTVVIKVNGRGIPDIAKAREPLFTTNTDGERSGMGFAFMEAFMDSLEVISKPDEGTCVRMKKRIESAKSREV